MPETKLIGIVNVTPDSFSDGGNALAPHDAIAAIRRLAEEGADVVDIGAESTRPDATPVTPEEEWRRLSSVLAQRFDVTIGVDTRHAATAGKALAAGVQWINDVSGFADAAMVEAVKASSCKLVVMHSLSVPADKHIVLPESADAVAEVLAFGKARVAALEAAGIARARLIFDPGIGFGKTPEQSLHLLRNISTFRALGVKLLVGHSRKSFLGAGDRDAATLEVSRALMKEGVDYLRVHDVTAHKRLLEAVHG